MSSSPTPVLPADPLLALASVDTQRKAARMAQDAFARVFRLTLGEEESVRREGVADLRAALANWAKAGADNESTAAMTRLKRMEPPGQKRLLLPGRSWPRRAGALAP